MFCSCVLKCLWLLLAIELSVGRTVTTHREMKIDPNGRKYTKVWTSYEEEPPIDDKLDAEEVLDDTFKSFPNPFKHSTNYPYNDDVEMLPSSFGTHQFPSDDNSFLDKGFNTEVVQEVMKTKKPVVTTTTDPDGTVRTTTYKLEPDGSISMKTRLERKPTITRHQWVETKPRPMPKEDPWANFNKQFEWPTPSRYPIAWPSPEDTEILNRDKPTTSTSTTTTTTTTTTTPKPIITTTQKPKVFTTPMQPPVNFLKTTTPLPSLEDFLKTTTPLPNLEDFLKTQYGHAPPGRTDNTPKPVTTLQLEDMPITAVLANGKPIHPDAFVKSLNFPQHPKPISSDFIPKDIEHTRVHSLKQNVNTSSAPKINDLEPDMQDMLRRAGITPAELESTNGDIIKTRTEPDGRIVTTRYKVRKMPTFTPYSPNVQKIPTSLLYPDLHSSGSRAGVKFPIPFEPVDNTKKHIIDSSEIPSTFSHDYARPSFHPSITPYMPSIKNPIDDFLALLNLRAADILSLNNGEFNKMIADDKGRVLTMRLVLSLPMGSQEEVKPLPNK